MAPGVVIALATLAAVAMGGGLALYIIRLPVEPRDHAPPAE